VGSKKAERKTKKEKKLTLCKEKTDNSFRSCYSNLEVVNSKVNSRSREIKVANSGNITV
jgi:hypothetical protein